MSNIFHIECSQEVTDDEFTEALFSVVRERFGSKVVVESSSKYSTWYISVGEDVTKRNYGFELFRENLSTFSGKFVSFEFTSWLSFYIRENVADRLNAILRDVDDTKEAWEPTPDKYPTYESWVHSQTVGTYEAIQKSGKEMPMDLAYKMKEGLLESVPKELLEI